METARLRQELLQAFARFPGTTVDVCLCMSKHIDVPYSVANDCVLNLHADGLLLTCARDQRLKPIYTCSPNCAHLLQEPKRLTAYEKAALEKNKAYELSRAVLQQKVIDLLRQSSFYLGTLELSDQLRIPPAEVTCIMASLFRLGEVKATNLLWKLA